MSIKGFQIGEGSVQKYDYRELDNKPTVPVVDATLATTGEAADAKKTGDEIADLKSAISDIDSQVNGTAILTPTAIPLSDFSIIGYRIDRTNGKWYTQNNSGYIIALSDVVKVSITGHESRDTYYAFLSANSPEDNTSAPIVGGVSVPTIIESQETAVADVPDTASFLYIQRVNSNGYRTDPSDVDFYAYVAPNDSIVGEIETIESDIDDLNEKVSGLDTVINGTQILTPTDKSLSEFTLKNYMINLSNGKWETGTNRGYFIDLGECKKVSFAGNASYKTQYAFLTNDTYVENSEAPIVGGSYPTEVALSGSVEQMVPDGATVLYIRRLDGNGHNVEPSSIKFYYYGPGDDSLIHDVIELQSDVAELEGGYEEVEPITGVIPFIYQLENKTISGTGEITSNNKRVLSPMFDIKNGNTISTDGGYSFRLAIFSSADATVPSAVTNWGTTYTANQDAYVRFNGEYGFNDNVYITPESISHHITQNAGMPITYIDTASKASLGNYKAYDPMNLNDTLYNNEDMIWTWWTYPQVVSFSKVRDKLYWIYTTRDGFSGVASYDYNTKQIVKTHLKKAGTDDHNAPAVFVRSSGKVIVAYSGGHNSDRYMHIRHSTTLENIEHFEDDIAKESWSDTCYAQIFEYNSNLYIFYRRQNEKWMYIKSTDGGYTWSDEVMVINASMQYYCKVTPTTTDGVLRLVMYSNPTDTDPKIRMGFIHLDNGKIYNADNSTELGTSNVSHTSFTVMIDLEDSTNIPYQRMFDVAITAPNVTRILYCQFSDDVSGDAVYMLYDSGNKRTICSAGYPIWVPKYQCGCAFITSTKIVVAYNADGKDKITIWEYDGTSVTQTKLVYEEAIGTVPIRNARPIVDINAKAIIWHRGYYNPSSFTDFVTDAKIYDIDEDEIII